MAERRAVIEVEVRYRILPVGRGVGAYWMRIGREIHIGAVLFGHIFNKRVR